MNMRLTMSIRTTQKQECSVCLQNHDSQRALEHTIEANLFGTVAFAMCPCCGQKAPNMSARAYLARAARWVQKQSIAALQKRLGPCRGEDANGVCALGADCPKKRGELLLCPLTAED